MILTHTKRTLRKEDWFDFIKERYAKIFQDMVGDTMPESEIGERMSEIATLVTSIDDKKHLLRHNKSTWFKVLSKTVKESIEDFEQVKKMHDDLRYPEYKKTVRKTLLKQATLRRNRALKARKACENVIADLREHLGDDE